MMTTYSNGKANVRGSPNEASNVDGLCKIAKSCNACGKECTKHCSRCRLVFYCSVNCQRHDWKRHKKECKIVPKKKEDIGPTLASLPDDLLVQIGKWVAKICDIRSYLALSMTSKRFQTLLTNEATASSIIEKESLLAAHRFIRDCNLDVLSPHSSNAVKHFFNGFPKTFQEMQLFRTASELMPGNRLYFFNGNEIVNLTGLARTIKSIREVMTLNPSAFLLLDTHSGTFTGSAGIDTSRAMGMAIGLTLARMFAEVGGPNAVEWMMSRVFIRSWGTTARESAIAMQDKHAKEVAKGWGWVDVFFRAGDEMRLEFPPRPMLYAKLPFPEVIPYSMEHERYVRVNGSSM